MFTSDTGAQRAPHAVTQPSSESLVATEVSAGGLLVGFDGDEPRFAHIEYALPDEEASHARVGVKRFYRWTGSVASFCANGVRTAHNGLLYIRQTRHGVAAESPLPLGEVYDPSGRSQLPALLEAKSDASSIAPIEVDASAPVQVSRAPLWPQPEAKEVAQAQAHVQGWESMWRAALQGLRTSPTRTLGDLFTNTPSASLAGRTTAAHSNPRASQRAMWSQLSRLEVLELRKQSRIQGFEHIKSLWEAIDDHSFEQMMAYEEVRRGVEVPCLEDLEMLLLNAKHRFLGAIAHRCGDQAPELTLEQKHERFLADYQQTFMSLSERRAHIASEEARVRKFIEQKGTGIWNGKGGEVVTADFAQFVHGVLGAVADRWAWRRKGWSGQARGGGGVTKDDLARFLSYPSELAELGEQSAGTSGIHVLALEAALARAGVYASDSEQTELERRLNSQPTA